VERVEVLLRQRVPRDGVDREVAAPGGIDDGHRRVTGHVKPAMTSARLGVASREGHVDVGDLVDLEALAYRLQTPECPEHDREPIGRKTEDLDIDVLRLASEQAVSDRAADDQGTAAGGVDRCGNGPRQRQVSHYPYSPSPRIPRSTKPTLAGRSPSRRMK